MCGFARAAQLIDNILQLLAQENRDDRWRRLCRTQTMIVARNRGGLAQQIRVSVNCFHDARQNQKELYIFVRRLARIHHVDAVVARQGPVVVLTGTIDSVKWFLIQQTGQTVMSCDTLHRLHDHLVAIDCQIDLAIGWC